MQTDDTLILADNNFANKKEVEIKAEKIMTKDREHLTSTQSLKFKGAKIKLDLKDIILKKKSHVGNILLVTNHVADSTSSREITRKRLSPKKWYLVQRVRGTYIAFMYYLKSSFDLFRAAPTVKFSSDDIAILNKRLQ